MENKNRFISIIFIILLIGGFFFFMPRHKEEDGGGFENKKYFHPPGGIVSVIPHRDVKTLIPASNLFYTQFRFKNDIHAKRDLNKFLKMCGYTLELNWVKTRYHPRTKPFFIVVLTNLDTINFGRDLIAKKSMPPLLSRIVSSESFDERYIHVSWTNAREIKGNKAYITQEELEAAKQQKPSIITRWLQPIKNDEDVTFTLWRQDHTERISIWNSGGDNKKLLTWDATWRKVLG